MEYPAFLEFLHPDQSLNYFNLPGYARKPLCCGKRIKSGFSGDAKKPLAVIAVIIREMYLSKNCM